MRKTVKQNDKYLLSELLIGGATGIEGSIFTASFLLFIVIVLYYLAKKEGKIL